MNGAVNGGHLDVFKWLFKNGYPFDYDEIIGYAIKMNELNIIKFLKTQCYKLPNDTCDTAMNYGGIDVMKWAYENGYYQGYKYNKRHYNDTSFIVKWMDKNNLLDGNYYEYNVNSSYSVDSANSSDDDLHQTDNRCNSDDNSDNYDNGDEI